LNPKSVEKKVTARTKAILTIDLYGHPSDYNKLKIIAKKHNLLLIADSCQSFGAKYYDAPIVYQEKFLFF
jgi:dTDP-4-amino-4,6-dideoxygalactose transaminase